MKTINTQWITVDEMKNRLSISKTLAYQIANDGSLDTVRIGRCLRISEESLDRWLDSQQHMRDEGRQFMSR
jgi:excisionase family DNA binding protein